MHTDSLLPSTNLILHIPYSWTKSYIKCFTSRFINHSMFWHVVTIESVIIGIVPRESQMSVSRIDKVRCVRVVNVCQVVQIEKSNRFSCGSNIFYSVSHSKMTNVEWCHGFAIDSCACWHIDCNLLNATTTAEWLRSAHAHYTMHSNVV